MEHIIVEADFETPFSSEMESETSKKVDEYLDKSGGRWIRSYYTKDHRKMICEFLAPDTETVRQAFATSGIPAASVWPAEVYAREALADVSATAPVG